MPNPLWTRKTWWRGGGDAINQDRRLYRYHFEDEWFRFATPYRARIELPFHTLERNTNGDTHGHWRVLANPDFTIRHTNVMDWAQECVTRGKADFLFEVDAGYPFEIPRPPTKFTLTARFSDKSLAMLFKLTFG